MIADLHRVIERGVFRDLDGFDRLKLPGLSFENGLEAIENTVSVEGLEPLT